MPGDFDAVTRLSRRVLLDALEALESHREAVILAGAQAIYLHTQDADLAVAPYTADAGIGKRKLRKWAISFWALAKTTSHIAVWLL